MNFYFLKNLRLFWWLFIIYTTSVTSLIVAKDINWNNILLLSFSLCMTSYFACLHNDILDQKCDSINLNNGNGQYIYKTNKHLISLLLIVLFTSSLVAASLISFKAILFISAILLILILYNYLKYFSSFSILLSTVSASTPIILPIIFWSGKPLAHLATVISLLFLIAGREIAGDINDQKGDTITGKKIPVRIGKRNAFRLIWLNNLFASLVLFISTLFSTYFFSTIATIIFIGFMVIITFINIKWNDKGHSTNYIKLTRIAMLLSPFLFLQK